MDDQNQWEYDYSRLYNQNRPAEDTGYANVGSSGNNAANRYQEPAAQPGPAPAQSSISEQTPPPSFGYNGEAHYTSGGTVPPAQPPRTKRGKGTAKKIAGRALALVLAAAFGFAGGFVGSRYGAAGSTIVMQSVERDASSASATATSAGSGSLSLTAVSSLVSPSVVVITTEAMVSTGSWYGQGYVESGAGSGVIMSSDGYILTCAHVISGASQITVTIDDTDYSATVIGEDGESDIAVIKIEATGLTAAVMGDSDSLAVGEEVVAVGNPLGELGGTVTNGIISALNRDVVVEDQNMSLIQTNASVSPGNSGGGLFNMAGDLIGIVNAKSSDSDAEGLGFAIPINTAFEVARQLIETGYVSGRPALGVTVVTINDATTAAQYGVSAYGVYIYSVSAGSGAEKAGLKSGDRVLSINEVEVAQSSNLTDVIAGCAVGDTVTLTVARSGQVMSVQVTLGDKNATGASADTNSGSEQGTDNGSLLPGLPENGAGQTVPGFGRGSN